MSDLNINEIDRMNWRSWGEAFADAASVKPKEVNPLSWRMLFYQDYLWRLFLGSVEVNVPEHWYIDYVRRVLFLGGAFAVTKWQGVVVPAAYTVDTRNAWKAPITIRSMDEVDFGIKTIGEDCEIIYLNDSYHGTSSASIGALIDVFAQKLANADGAIDVNLLNSRAAMIFQAADGGEALTFKALFTKIMNGEPAVFWRKTSKRAAISKDDTLPITTLPIKQNYVADLIQDSKRDIVNEFLTMIGVANNNTEKKERLVVDEVNANNEETSYSVALWQANIDRQLKKVKAMFPECEQLNIKFKATIKDYFYTGKKGGGQNANVNKLA